MVIIFPLYPNVKTETFGLFQKVEQGSYLFQTILIHRNMFFNLHFSYFSHHFFFFLFYFKFLVLVLPLLQDFYFKYVVLSFHHQNVKAGKKIWKYQSHDLLGSGK